MKFKNILIVSTLALALTACGSANNSDNGSNTSSNAVSSEKSNDNKASSSVSSNEASNENSDTVKIKDIHGEVEVKKNPESVVSLDNRTFETLESWGVKLKAAPKDVMKADSAYVKDESVENIGNHREPNLEVLAAVKPDVVIVGQRFKEYYDQIKELLPDATIIDYSYDVSAKEGNAGENLINGFKESTEGLGKIFGKENEANELIEKLDKSIKDVKDNYKDQSVMSLVVSGGEIGFAAPHSGRVWGPLYDIFNFKPALEVEESSSDHKGDDVSVEAIAESDPDYLLVLDRDASMADEESKPAKDVIEESEALANTNAVKNQKIVYAPNDTYLNESIQTFTEIFESLAESFKN